MGRTHFLVLLSGLLVGLLCPPDALAAPPTAADLVAKNAAARGGAKKLHGTSTLRVEGQMITPGGSLRLDYVQLQSRPQSLRVEVTLQGLTQISAWDGAEAWQINPFGGRKDPQRLPLEDAKGLIEQASVEGALQQAAALGYPIAYAGTEEIDGTAAHKLVVSRPGGDVETIYLDPDAFLEIRMVTRRTQHGVISESQTDYADYEAVGGVFYPFLIELGAKDATDDRMKVVISTITPNVPIDDALFHFPATGPAVGATP